MDTITFYEINKTDQGKFYLTKKIIRKKRNSIDLSFDDLQTYNTLEEAWNNRENI